MVRREFLLVSALAAMAAASPRSRRFEFRIKTKSGGIVSGIVITGTDLDNAKYKLLKRYKEATIISSKEL